MSASSTRLIKLICCLSLVMGMAVGSTTWLQAQSSFGTIKGVVSDASEAAVPGATVTITNTRTSVARQVTTNESGLYQVGSLIPGFYTIKAEKQDFKSPRCPNLNCGSTRWRQSMSR